MGVPRMSRQAPVRHRVGSASRRCSRPAAAARRRRPPEASRPTRPRTRSAWSTPSPARSPPTASSTSRLPGRSGLRHQRHQQGRHPPGRGDRGRRRRRPGQGGLGGQGPHRQGRQGPRRLDRLGRRHCRSRRSPRRTRCCSSRAPAATDGLTGKNRYTFRSGRQSYQDVLTAKSFIGGAAGQEGARLRPGQRVRPGQRGRGQGGHRRRRRDGRPDPGAGRAPPSSPRSPSRRSTPSPTCSSWPGPAPPPRHVAGAGPAGRAGSTTVVTGLDIRASWPTFGAAGAKISFLAHYFDGAADRARPTTR